MTHKPNHKGKSWYASWQACLKRKEASQCEASQLMREHSHAVIPRNHRVEEALEAAVEREDLSVKLRLLETLRTPYDQHSDRAYYVSPAPDGTPHYKTYCGT